MVSLERESALKLIQEKKWLELLHHLKNNKNFQKLSDDLVFGELFHTYFVDEILNGKTNNSAPPITELTAIYNFHTSQKYNFQLKEHNFKKLILKLVDFTKELKYANHFPAEDSCKRLIEQQQIDRKSEVERVKSEYEISQKFKVQHIEKKSSDSFVISIFKSPQELEFYKAASRVFIGRILIPNAALSAVINNDVTEKLEKQKRWYFYSTTVDLVIIDEKTYKPLFFFEIDSKYHDNDEQKRKDNLKNELISEAGFTLYRTRKITGSETEEDFEKLLISWLNK